MQNEVHRKKGEEHALTKVAFIVRTILDIARTTFTRGDMVAGRADGINSTVLVPACMLAAALVANLRVRALVVGRAGRDHLHWRGSMHSVSGAREANGGKTSQDSTLLAAALADCYKPSWAGARNNPTA